MDKQALNIDRYINGGMNVTERTGFEAQMAVDPFLAEAVDGFGQDPGALYDLPVSNGVNINWWWSIIGFVAVATVFLSIPNKIIELPEISTLKTEVVHIIVDDDKPQPASQRALILPSEMNKTISKAEVTPTDKEENSRELLAAEYVDLKAAKPIHKIEIPSLKVDEKVIYILDLKVVKNKLNDLSKQEIELSELTNFTPASFSTTIAFRRARQYEGIFPEPKSEAYFDKLEKGLRQFKSENYIVALEVFSALLNENNQDPNAQFYSALSHYYLGDYLTAETDFARMEKLRWSAFSPESKWYRALSLKKLGRNNEAQDLLLEIVEGGGHYSERARGMVKK